MQKPINEHSQYILSQQELKGLHEVLLELLVEFDRICKKNNIIYSIDGGTLLGAIRHEGFVPWDDDADVIMVRSQYEKFRKVCAMDLNAEKFYFQDMRNTRGYRWGYGKLRRKGTKCVRLNQEHMPYHQGIYLDIFVCDNVPENYPLRCIFNFVSYIYRKIFWSEVGKIENTRLKKMLYTILSLIPERRLKKSYFRFIKKFCRRHSKWVKCITFPARNSIYGFKREWYEDVIDVRFENVILKGSRKYDEYLKFMYGNYMTLPPENERIVHPVSEFALPTN